MDITGERSQSEEAGRAPAGAACPPAAADAADAADAMLQAAFVHHQAGRASEASALYQRILAQWPAHVDALHFLGLLHCEMGEPTTGIACIRESIRLRPDAIYLNNFGNALLRAGDMVAAIAAYRDALVLNPGYVEAHSNLGNALRQTGDFAGAIDSCAAALALKPEHAEAWNNLANAFKGQGDSENASKCYAKALDIRPDYAEAHNNLGNLFEAYDRLSEATMCYRRAVECMPAAAMLRSNLGNVLRDQGLLDEGVACYRDALALDPDLAQTHSSLLLQLNFLPHVPLREQFDEARSFGDRQTARARPFVHAPLTSEADAARRLRVGFVSGDLKTHPVGFFLENVVRHVNPAQVELVAYATRRGEDALTDRLKPHFAQWHCIVDLGDEAAAHRIRADGIDILVDLSGHTNHNRLPMFAWRPAPVQVSWLGYFASTGLRAIDYILGDPHVLPPAEASHFVERAWRLPDSYLCFTPPQVDIAVGPLPALTNGVMTFGSFNHLVKLNDAVVALWASVLHAVPTSRLFLKTKQLNDPNVCVATFERFEARGIDRTRLILEGESPRTELLAAYNRVDIALDPFPYPGGTTTVEALWMGVPVLTRRGDRFLSHVGESILHTVQLPHWIAADDDAYVAAAVAFAGETRQLNALRAGLRRQLLASPLCDAPLFARNLEAAFRGMWQQHVAAGQPGQRPRADTPEVEHLDRIPSENAPNLAEPNSQ